MQPRLVVANRISVVQLASSEESGFSKCDASVVGSKKSGAGSYENGFHGEINALEDYLSKGGKLTDITKIEISSAPCKYCNLVLTDLGIRAKVISPGGVGRCQGGSYGWFVREGHVAKALLAATGKDDDTYSKWVSERLSGKK